MLNSDLIIPVLALMVMVILLIKYKTHIKLFMSFSIEPTESDYRRCQFKHLLTEYYTKNVDYSKSILDTTHTKEANKEETSINNTNTKDNSNQHIDISKGYNADHNHDNTSTHKEEIDENAEKMIEKTNTSSSLCQAITRYNKNEDIGWNDICLLEETIIDLLSGEELILKEAFLKSRYKSIADDERYTLYETTINNAKAKTDNQQTLIDSHTKQRAKFLSSQIYWIYAIATKGHKLRKEVINTISKYFFCCMALFFLLPPLFRILKHLIDGKEIIAFPWSGFGFILSIACFGAFGGYVSFQRRMAKIRVQSETYIGFLQLTNSVYDGFIALASGAAFSLLLIVILASGVVAFIFGEKSFIHSLFPNIIGSGNCGISWIIDFYECISFADDADLKTKLPNIAKSLLLAFVSGFAEQLIPDAIDRLVDKARDKN